MSIIIYCAPIHSGKTTALMNWCSNKNTVGGILMADINGSRKFFNIETKEIFDAACKFPEQTNKTLISIGAYHFYEDAFLKANNILMNVSPSLTHIIIDEIGKLELKQKGLYEGAIQLLKRSHQNIILVIRDSLVESVISAFNLKNYSLITDIKELIF